jgi:hypothetical protein
LTGLPSTDTRAVLVSRRTGPQHISLVAWPAARRNSAAQPGKEFLDMERLGDIIVSAGVETLNLVAPPVAGRQNQHRHGAAGPPPFHEQGSAVLFGQAQIQDNGIVRFGVAQKPTFFAIEGAVDGVACPRKRGENLPIEVLVILDDEQPHASIRLLQKQCLAGNLAASHSVDRKARTPPFFFNTKNSMFVLRTDDLSGLGIDENANDATVAAQKAHLVDELLVPAAKLDPDGFRLRAARSAPHGTKRLKQPMRQNLFARLGRRETDAIRLWLRRSRRA